MKLIFSRQALERNAPVLVCLVMILLLLALPTTRPDGSTTGKYSVLLKYSFLVPLDKGGMIGASSSGYTSSIIAKYC